MKGFRHESVSTSGIGDERGSGVYSFFGYAIIVVVIVAGLLFFPWDQIKKSGQDTDFKSATTAMAEKNWDKAIELFDKSLKTNPNNADAYVGLSRAYQFTGKLAKAIESADKAVQIAPSNARAFGQFAMVNKLAGNTEAALKAFIRASQIDPKYAWALAQAADMLSQTGDLEKALDSANKALEARPDFSEALRLRATIFAKMGKCKEAFADFSQVEQLRPQDAGTIQDKAWFLLTCPDESIQDTSKAMDLAKKAMDLSKGGNGLVQETLAEAYFRTGNYLKAVEHQKKAIELQKKTCPDGSCVKDMQSRLKKYEMASREETRTHYDRLPKDSAY